MKKNIQKKLTSEQDVLFLLEEKAQEVNNKGVIELDDMFNAIEDYLKSINPKTLKLKDEIYHKIQHIIDLMEKKAQELLDGKSLSNINYHAKYTRNL